MVSRLNRQKNEASKIPQWVLRVERGPNKGTLYEVTSGTHVIGRKLDVEIPILDLSVSREHAVIRIEDGVPVVSDLRSKNGTFLNNKPLSGDMILHNGDRIQLGDTVFRISHKKDVDQDVFHRASEETISLELHTPQIQKSETFSEIMSEGGGHGGMRSDTISRFMMSNDKQLKKMRWMTLAVCGFLIVSAIAFSLIGASF